jgi:hypothetical protein
MKREKKKDETVRKVFIFDIDDTICNTDDAFVTLAYSLSFLEYSDPAEVDQRDYIHFSDCGLMAEEDEHKVIKIMDIMCVWERLGSFDGVYNLLKEINSKGHYIVYITKRPHFLREQTESWIERHSLPRPVAGCDLDSRVVLLVEGDDKAKALKRVVKYHGDRDIYYFENDPEYVHLGSKYKIPYVYTFDYGYNRNVAFKDGVKTLSNPRKGAFLDLDLSL